MSGYEALRSNAAWIDLSARGKIRVTGEDRARLLHAMSTNHIAGLQPSDGIYTFFLTAQGRIVADAFVYNFGDSLLLDTEPETADKLHEHLDKYIIADDVTLEDETVLWGEIAIEGPESLRTAGALGVPVPERQYAVTIWNSGFVVRVASTGATGLRIFIPTSQKHDLVARLNLPEAT